MTYIRQTTTVKRMCLLFYLHRHTTHAAIVPVFVYLCIATALVKGGENHPIQQAVRDRFTNWKRGEAEISTTGTFREAPYGDSWTIYFDGNRRKGYKAIPESQLVDLSHKGSDRVLDILCVNCLRDNTVVHFNNAKAGHGGPFALSVYDDSAARSPLHWLPDPRLLGLVALPLQLLRSVNPEGYYEDDVVNDMKPIDDTLDGEECVKYVRERRPTVYQEVWLSKKRSGVVMRVHAEWGPGDELVEDIRNAYIKVGDQWLPSACRYHRSANGKAEIDEEVKIAFRSFGEPLETDTFEIASFPNLMPGTSVNWTLTDIPPEGLPGQLVWDGTKIAAAPRAPGSSVAISANESKANSKRALLIVSVNIAIVSALVVVLCLRRRGKRS